MKEISPRVRFAIDMLNWNIAEMGRQEATKVLLEHLNALKNNRKEKKK